MRRSGRRLAVVALGGNALLRRGEPPDIHTERHNVEVATAAIASLADDHDLVITHGNGPQVGLLALQSAALGHDPDPLDVLDAASEGMIGYLLEQGLRNALPGRDVAVLLTQVVVNADDPAFRAPTKPIGPVYAESQARALASERGWTIAPDGDGYRRVVPSPEPRRIVEIEQIRLLLDAGAIVICVGGGGIPVVAGERDELRGVEAVIDKDLSTAVLAEQLGASMLLMLTDVPAVERDWGTARATAIRSITPHELSRMRFAAGSMQPKTEAARRFVQATGAVAAIGALAEAQAIVHGTAGTIVAHGNPG